MSLGNLTIREIAIDRFGGLTGRRIELPDHPFVVIHGTNEAGKSTLAECIAWLLAGPGGDAANAQRFGNPRDRIGGRLSGTVRGRPFTATGSFEVLQRGAPNDSGLKVDLDGTLNAAEWRTVVGGLDAAVLAAVYRLWGEQLHDGEGVEGYLSRIALAGISGLADPRALASELESRANTLGAGSRNQKSSVVKCRHRIDGLRAELRAAGSTAGEHLRVQRELEERRADRQRWECASAHHTAGATTARTVLGVTSQQVEISTLRAELGALAEVPDAWRPLVGDPAAVDTAVHGLDDAGRRSDDAGRDLTRLAAAVPVPLARLHELTLTDGDLTEAARVVTRHAVATDARRTARSALEVAEQHAAAVGLATDQLLGSVPDAPVSRDDLDRAALSPVVQGQLTRLLERWTDLARDAEAADHRRSLADADVDAATEHTHRMREAWSRHGSGTSAEEWMQRRALPAAAVPSRGPARLALPALVAVVALVAAAAGEWVSAGAAALAAVAVAVLALRPAATAEADPDAAAVTRTFETARQVLDAERQLADRTAEAARERGVASAALATVGAHASAVGRAFADHGLPTPADADQGARTLAAWSQASAALAVEREHAGRVAAAGRSLDTADVEVRRAAAGGTTVLARWGAPADTPLHLLEELASNLRQATDAARRSACAGHQLHEARAAYARLTAPVVGESGDLRPSRVAERVHELAHLDEQRRELERRIAAAVRERDARLGDARAVCELFERQLPVDELERLAAHHERDADEANARSRSISEEIGRLESQLDELAATERIAELELQLGGEREHLGDLVTEATAHALAARLLRGVAEEYERANQPAMVARATSLARTVAPEWEHVMVRPACTGDSVRVVVRQRTGIEVEARRLSTGARALLYLAFRISLAEHDAERRGLRLPLLCDDPLVHLDDRRACEVVPLFATAAADGHQVVLFTCHDRTVDAALAVGARVVRLDGA